MVRIDAPLAADVHVNGALDEHKEVDANIPLREQRLLWLELPELAFSADLYQLRVGVRPKEVRLNDSFVNGLDVGKSAALTSQAQ